MGIVDCIFLPDLGPAAALRVQLSVTPSKGSGPAAGSVVVTEDSAAPFDCADGTTTTTGPLTLTPLLQSHNEDALEWAPGKLFDSCTDYEELGTFASLGGLRDPFNPYDFYDVNGDGIVDLANDIVGVQAHYNLMQGQPGYEARFDRGLLLGPNGWNRAGPDGIIDLANDIVGVIANYAHSCQAAP